MLPKQTAKLLELANEGIRKSQIVSLCFQDAGWVVASSVEQLKGDTGLLVVGVRDQDGFMAVSAGHLIAVKAIPL